MDHHLVDTLELEEEVPSGMLVRERGRRIKAAAELGLARSRAAGRRGLAAPSPAEWTTASTTCNRRAPKSATPPREERRGADEEEEEEEDVVVEEKVALLRQLVPGGEGMAVEGLLEETADYIAALKAQVGVMRALACLLSGSGPDALTTEKAAGGLLAPDNPM